MLIDVKDGKENRRSLGSSVDPFYRFFYFFFTIPFALAIVYKAESIKAFTYIYYIFLYKLTLDRIVGVVERKVLRMRLQVT